MALAGIEIPIEPRVYGVVLNLVPGKDATTGLPWTGDSEIQRAPDNAGAPDTGNAVTIARIGMLPPAGGTYPDIRAPTGSLWWYRFRHVARGLDDGAYSGWVSAKPGLLPYRAVTPETYVGDGHRIQTASVEDEAISNVKVLPVTLDRERIGPTIVFDLSGLTSRSRFFNGGFEDIRAYWNSNPSGSGNTTLTVNNDGDTYKGTYSAKLAHTGGQTEYFYQSNEPRQLATDPGNWILWAVRPSRRIQVEYSCKVSGANVLGRLFIAEYSASGGFLSSTQVGPDRTNTAWADFSEEFTVGATTFWVVIRFGAAGSSTGSVWYDELYFTDLIPVNDTTGGWFDNGVKTGAFTLDFITGATQWVEINGTALAITFSNVEEGGVYVVYLKQNSAPDTVTWPGSVHWKQPAGAPGLSTTTGRIDRITFQRINAVDYASFETYWT